MDKHKLAAYGGLERYGFEEQAAQLRQATIGLVEEQGFFEHFNPMNGKGHGSIFFSWTAALLLDVLITATSNTRS